MNIFGTSTQPSALLPAQHLLKSQWTSSDSATVKPWVMGHSKLEPG